MSATTTEGELWRALEDVPDPELPAVSVVDLGVIASLEVEAGVAHVRLLPTFVGCPAVEQMRLAVGEAARALGLEPDVRVTYDEIWTSERISPRGRARLEAAGIAPPGALPVRTGLGIPLRPVASCPFCGSARTRRENAFGPTPCRGIWYCDACGQPFEAFKPV